jgi:hypothetical protein
MLSWLALRIFFYGTALELRGNEGSMLPFKSDLSELAACRIGTVSSAHTPFGDVSFACAASFWCKIAYALALKGCLKIFDILFDTAAEIPL